MSPTRKPLIIFTQRRWIRADLEGKNMFKTTSKREIFRVFRRCEQMWSNVSRARGSLLENYSPRARFAEQTFAFRCACTAETKCFSRVKCLDAHVFETVYAHKLAGIWKFSSGRRVWHIGGGPEPSRVFCRRRFDVINIISTTAAMS